MRDFEFDGGKGGAAGTDEPCELAEIKSAALLHLHLLISIAARRSRRSSGCNSLARVTQNFLAPNKNASVAQ